MTTIQPPPTLAVSIAASPEGPEVAAAQLTGPQKEMEAAITNAAALAEQDHSLTTSSSTTTTTTTTIHCVSRSSSCDSNVQQQQQQRQQRPEDNEHHAMSGGQQQQTTTTSGGNNNNNNTKQQQQQCGASSLVRKRKLLSTKSAEKKHKNAGSHSTTTSSSSSSSTTLPVVDTAKTFTSTLLENHIPPSHGSTAATNAKWSFGTTATTTSNAGNPPVHHHQQQAQDCALLKATENVAAAASCPGKVATMQQQPHHHHQQQPSLLEPLSTACNSSSSSTSNQEQQQQNREASRIAPAAASAGTNITHASASSSCLEFLSPTSEDTDTTTESSVDDDNDDNDNNNNDDDDAPHAPAASSTTAGTKLSSSSLFGSTTPPKQPEATTTRVTTKVIQQQQHRPPPAGSEKVAPSTTTSKEIIDHEEAAGESNFPLVAPLVAAATAAAGGNNTSAGKSALSSSSASLSMIPAGGNNPVIVGTTTIAATQPHSVIPPAKQSHSAPPLQQVVVAPAVVNNGSSKCTTATSSQENKQTQESSTTTAAAATASNKRIETAAAAAADYLSARSSTSTDTPQNPSLTTIPTLTDKDIVLGGGRGYNPGQAYIRFQSVIANVAKDYVIGESNKVLIHRVVNHVENQQGGRFLEHVILGGADSNPLSTTTLFHVVPRNKVCDKIEILLRRAFDRLPRIPTPMPCQMDNVAAKENNRDGDNDDDKNDESDTETESEEEEEEESSTLSHHTFSARPNASSVTVPAKQPAVTNMNPRREGQAMSMRLPPPAPGGGKSATSTSSYEQTENGESSLHVPPLVAAGTTSSTPRHESPSSSIQGLTEKDIVMGRGSFSMHIGNVNYRNLVTKFASFFVPSNKSHNDALVMQILDHISSHGGRFVEEDPDCCPRGSMFRLAARFKVEAKIAILLQRRYNYTRSQSSKTVGGGGGNDEDSTKKSTRNNVDASAGRTDKPSSKAATRSDAGCSSTLLLLTQDDAPAEESSTRKVAASDTPCTDKPLSEAVTGAADANRSISLTKDDVCIGRQFLFYPGNVAFRAVVAEVAKGQIFVSLDMVNTVIERIASSGGRFLEKKNGNFCLASTMQVNEKIHVALQRSIQNTIAKTNSNTQQTPNNVASASLHNEEEPGDGNAAMSVIERVKFAGRTRSKPVRFAPSMAAAPIILDEDHDEIDEKEMEKCAGKLAKQRQMAGGRVALHPHDVICGKGSYQHGNLYFRELINERGYRYQASTMEERQEIICEIVDLIQAQDPPGRFLAVHKKGIYKVASQETVQLKIRSSLRRPMPPPMAMENGNHDADAIVPDAPTSAPIFMPGNNSNNPKKRDSTKEPPAGQAPPKRRKSVSKSVVAFEQQKGQSTLPSERRKTAASNSVLMKPGPTDVLCIKGQPKTSLCPGEKYFRDLIRKYREKYFHTADATKRAKIRAKIERLIQNQSPPGRFLELDTATQTYHLASDERISKKLDLALSRRDNLQRGGKKKTPPPLPPQSQPHSTALDQTMQRIIPRPPIHATPASRCHFITVNSRVSVLWVSLNAYFPGTIEEILPSPNAAAADGASIGIYNIRYDDDTTEMVDLTRRKFKILQLAKQQQQEEEANEGDDDDRKPSAKLDYCS